MKSLCQCFSSAFIQKILHKSIKNWRDGRRPIFEELQPRVLLSSTPTFIATAISGTEILLNWDLPDSNVTGYTIRASANSNDDTFVVGSIATGQANVYLIENLAVQTTYTFSLWANNGTELMSLWETTTATTFSQGNTGYYDVQIITVDILTGETGSQPGRIFAGSQSGADFKARNGDHPNYELITLTHENSLKITTQAVTLSSSGGGGGGTVGPANSSPSGIPNQNTPAAAGAGEGTDNDSDDPIRYIDGAVVYSESDLISYAFGSTWGQTRSWSQQTVYANSLNGNGWNVAELPWIRSYTQNGVLRLSIVFSGTDQSEFYSSNGQSWTSTSYLANTLTATALPSPTAPGQTVRGFIYTDTTGQQYTFYGFDANIASSLRGRLYSATDAYGNVTSTAYNATGQLLTLSRSNISGTGTNQNGVVISLNYTYLDANNPNTGKIASVTMTQQKVVNGVWQAAVTVRQVQYSYYQGTYQGEDAFGNRGDLKLAAILDPSGNVIDETYYRYYTPYNNAEQVGYIGGLQYIFGASAVVRLKEMFSSPFLTGNQQVAAYATHAFQYDSFQRATQHTIAGMSNNPLTGDSAPGVYSYQYIKSSAYTLYSDVNTWSFETIETLPDGNQNIIFTNNLGQVLMKVHKINVDLSDPSNIGKQWITAYQYNESQQLVRTISSSAISSYDTGYLDLGISNGLVYANDGLIEIITYATATTATITSAGNVKGYITARYIQEGLLSTPVKQESYTYIMHQDASGNVIYVRASDTVYRNTNGTGAETTYKNYTWYTGTNRIASITTTLPVITTDQNGSGMATSISYVYDQYGRTIWTRDDARIVTYRAYDAATGAVIQYVQDVNIYDLSGLLNVTVGLPPGWSSADGLHLVTSYEVDAFGRTIRETDPKGNVTYTLYDDANHAVLTIAGVTETFDANGNGTITSNQVISLVHRRIGSLDTSGSTFAGVYDETITFTGTLTVINGVIQFPDFNASGTVNLIGNGTIEHPQFIIQSLSRSLYDSSYTMVEYDNYVCIDNAIYLAKSINSPYSGSQNINYNATMYGYDANANFTRMQDAGGTISIYLYDALNRLVAEYVGTNDATTDGKIWHVTNAAASSDMTLVTSYEYDNHGIGNSNLTKVIDYVDSNPANNEVTEYLYDKRDRLIATKSGAQAAEDANVNRPLIVYELNNLGDILSASIYDADGLSMVDADHNGIPDALSADILRAKTLYSYDNWGRIYRTETLSVDSATGITSSTGLVDQVWYDQRGNLIKVQSSAGLVTKYAYDRLNRLATVYHTDGGNDITWANAGNVDMDIVLDQERYIYDANGNVIETIYKTRFHNATGIGELGDANSGVRARVSYTLSYYDELDQLIANVNLGANNIVDTSISGQQPDGTYSSIGIISSDGIYLGSLVWGNDFSSFTGVVGGGWIGSLGKYGVFLIQFTENQTVLGDWFSYTGEPGTWGEGFTALYERPETLLNLVSELIGDYGPFNTSAVWDNSLVGTTLPGWVDTFTDANGDGMIDVLQGPVPARSDTALVYSYTYTSLGLLDTYTDARGIVTKYQYDNLGHKTAVIEAYTDGVPTDSTNRTTLYTYDSVGHVISMTAVAPTGGTSQTTQYVYGVNKGIGPSESTIASNNLLAYIAYPDKTTGQASASSSDQVHYTYNSWGQILTATDQNGTVHTYTYDILGRQISDVITTLGDGVDGGVRRIDAVYDIFGSITLLTSYADTAGTQIVSQIKREYNGLGQLIAEYQAATGVVDTATTPRVQYSYSDVANGSRLLSMTYPNGRVIYYNYDVGIDGTIGRLSSISDSTGILESYTYLGLSTVVEIAHLETGINLTYIKQAGDTQANSDAGDIYTGLDRFGDVVDQNWINSAFSIQNSEFTSDHYQYTYDRNGNVTAKNNLTNGSLNETYTYDVLDRLTSTTRNGATYQEWDLDALGNSDITTDGVTEDRDYNSQNQDTSLSYDHNGNTLTDEAGNQYVYDAWNHLVQVKDAEGNILRSYTYDGLGRRITETTGSGESAITTTLYYNANWQVVEEHSTDAGTGAAITTTYVWSATYIDAMICRDRTITIAGYPQVYERVYALYDANYNVVALVGKVTLPGDLDGNGVVNNRDISLFNNYYNCQVTGGPAQGDFDYDGVVGDNDVTIISCFYGNSASAHWAVIERYSYDAYGKVTVLNGTVNPFGEDGTVKEVQTTALGWQYLHQGGRLDSTTGLYNFRNRDYNPETQRWMQQDPLGYVDGANRYQAYGSNPIYGLDPWGLTTTITPAAPSSAPTSSAPPPGSSGIPAVDRAGLVGIAALIGWETGQAIDRNLIKPWQTGELDEAQARAEAATAQLRESQERRRQREAAAKPPETQPGPVPAPSTPDAPQPGTPPKNKPTTKMDGGDNGDPGSEPKPDQDTPPEDKPQQDGPDEAFNDPADAIGDVNGEATKVGEGKTKSDYWNKQGYTDTHYYRDSNGVKHTVFYNPTTGKFSGGHESSGQ